jgi:hypothetical protein
MKLGICTIQRNRGKWLSEWVVFHHLVGFTNFYIYLHKCDDNSKQVVMNLKKHFNIQCFEISSDTVRPQLAAYQHAYQEFGHEIDWMAFIDGDEFLHPSSENKVTEVLEHYRYKKISALGVYWQCFGSGGHVEDPNGLIIEDYQYRANLDFLPNRHIKSIVKGGQGQYCLSAQNSHLFHTVYGTFDEKMRVIDKGWMKELEPSYEHLRINHYVCQSLDYFKNFKQNSGAADAGADHIRQDSWWHEHDRNEEKEDEILRYAPQVNELLKNISREK